MFRAAILGCTVLALALIYLPGIVEDGRLSEEFLFQEVDKKAQERQRGLDSVREAEESDRDWDAWRERLWPHRYHVNIPPDSRPWRRHPAPVATGAFPRPRRSSECLKPAPDDFFGLGGLVQLLDCSWLGMTEPYPVKPFNGKWPN